MKKTSLALAALVSCLLFACQKADYTSPDLRTWSLKGQVKSVLVNFTHKHSDSDLSSKELDLSGERHLTKAHFNRQGKIQSSRVQYNNFDRTATEKLMTADAVFKYDKAGLLVEDWHQMNEQEPKTQHYQYQPGAKQPYQAISQPDKQLTKLEYDTSGNIILVQHFNAQQRPVLITKYEYNAQNQMTKKTTSDNPETPVLQELFYYDKQGFLTQYKQFEDKVLSATVVTFKYLAVDKQGNWTKRQSISSNKPNLEITEVRTIEYY